MRGFRASAFTRLMSRVRTVSAGAAIRAGRGSFAASPSIGSIRRDGSRSISEHPAKRAKRAAGLLLPSGRKRATIFLLAGLYSLVTTWFPARHAMRARFPGGD